MTRSTLGATRLGWNVTTTRSSRACSAIESVLLAPGRLCGTQWLVREGRLAELPNLLELASFVDCDVKEEVNFQITSILELETIDLMAERRIAI